MTWYNKSEHNRWESLKFFIGNLVGRKRTRRPKQFNLMKGKEPIQRLSNRCGLKEEQTYQDGFEVYLARPNLGPNKNNNT